MVQNICISLQNKPVPEYWQRAQAIKVAVSPKSWMLHHLLEFGYPRCCVTSHCVLEGA